MSEFESEIERELHRVLDPTLATSIPAWAVPARPSMARRLLGGAGVAVGVKVLTGIAVAAAAVTIAGAATETAVTGSASPLVWGQQVKLQVEACKDRLAAGQHGIGECVSDFTTKHGDTTSDSHQSPEADETKNPGDKKPAHPTADRSPGRPGQASPPSDRSGSQSHPIPPRP